MHFAFTEEQLLFRDAVREALSRACPPAKVRAAWDTDAPLAAWTELAEMGVVGATAPESVDGLGLGDLDLVLIMEEAGRAALPDPLLENTAVAIPLLQQLGDDDTRKRWLPALASGDGFATVQLGGSPFAVDAARASVILVEQGNALHAVPRDRADLSAETSVDGARKLYRMTTNLGAETLVADGPEARAGLDLAFNRGAVAAAAQLLGLAGYMLESTVEYVKVRTQFGKPIGSFQAIKHHLAAAHVKLELSRPCVYRAAYGLAREEPDAPVFVSLAKARASEAALLAARTALQCHGAIGYSFEYDLQLWMKRAWALAASWGDAAWHKDRVATSVLDAPQPQTGESHA